MDWPYAHLFVNHFPIILTLVGSAAALVALLLRRRATWLYAVATLTLAGATVYPAVYTGEAAEEVMEHTWYVEHDAIEEHEEAGEVALWVLLAMGALSGVAWWRLVRRHEPLPRWLELSVVLAAVAGSVSVLTTAAQGRALVHQAPKLTQEPGPGAPGSEPAVPASPATPVP